MGNVRKKGDVESGLRKKGFKSVRQNKHLHFLYHTIDDCPSVIGTHLSHNNKDLDEHLLHAMAGQCKVSMREFLDLIDCKLGREEYEALLINRDFL